MKNNIIKILICSLLPMFGGCAVVGLLATPSGSEEVVEAEFDISERYDEKILVLVNQPSWVNPPANLRKELTNKINSYMRVYFKKMPKTSIIDYETVRDARQDDLNFHNKGVIDLASDFNAGLVLYVEILDFNFLQLTAAGYYSTEMKTLAVLYDGSDGKSLWPETKGEGVTSLEIECEKGVENTISRLATANAHCILRNFYDCKRQKYKVIEEKKQFEMEQW